MDTAVLRRYLQPSPTLRWHPWAPLAFALLSLAFVFYLGAKWGFSAGSRVAGEMMVTMPASDVLFRHEDSKSEQARMMAREARKLDVVVHGFIVEQGNPPGVLDQWRGRLESVMFFHGHSRAGLPREYAVKLAELRLAEFSAANPQWRQVTATGCPAHRSIDFIGEYRELAVEYSQLLGRTVRPEDLAPAVPGGKCTF
ncbi:MAG: hypothetical protein WA190_09630 [Usitatibacter sp.]